MLTNNIDSFIYTFDGPMDINNYFIYPFVRLLITYVGYTHWIGLLILVTALYKKTVISYKYPLKADNSKLTSKL